MRPVSGRPEQSESQHVLLTLLEQLVEGQYDLWQQVAGRRELLRSALRQAVREAPSSEDVAPQLERCWALLTDDRTALRVAEFYRCDPDYEQVAVDHERVLLGALRLAATAQAAVSALQVGRAPDAAGRLDRWSQVAVELFATRENVPEPVAEGAPAGDPRELVRRTYQRFGGLAGGALFWTLDWLDATSAAEVMKVPLVGYHPSVGGFCADLRIRLIPGEAELVEHPDMALRSLGPELRGVMRDACRAASAAADGARSRSSVCWSLTVRDRSLDPLLPLDGGSLSGAARAGLLLLRSGGRYDPRSVIAARAEPGGQLLPVGFERDKLEAAAEAGLRLAVVAPGAALSEADRDDLEGRGLKLRKAAGIEEAVRLVRARRTRAPFAVAAAVVVVVVGALLFIRLGPLRKASSALPAGGGWMVSEGATSRPKPLRAPPVPLREVFFGDFDGTGTDDAFQTCCFSRGTFSWRISYSDADGEDWSEWKEVNRSAAPLDWLRFGDFNGDGTIDIFRSAPEGPYQGWYVSRSTKDRRSGQWGPKPINKLNTPIEDLTVGDFDGDGTDDVLRSAPDGTYVSYSAISEWHKVLNSGAPMNSLKVGDFNGDGTDDIFRVSADGVWSVSFSNRERKDWSQWRQINKTKFSIKDLTLTVGDFDGDGKADIFRSNSDGWFVWFSGRHKWTRVNHRVPATVLGFADVNGDKKTDVIYFARHK